MFKQKITIKYHEISILLYFGRHKNRIFKIMYKLAR